MIISHKDKVVLVTGGSEGIGRAIAKSFAADGAKVAICARTKETVDQAARELQEETGSEVRPFVCDVAKPEEIRAFVDGAAKHFGRIDVLVNNAHAPILGMPTELSDEVYEETVRVKPLGYVYCSLAAIPHMKKQGSGRIIMILGDSLRSPGIGVTAGIANVSSLNFAKALSDELAPDNIRVVCVAPGLVNTRRWPWIAEYLSSKESIPMEQANGMLLNAIPLKRLGEPEEIANVVSFMASDLASYMTGCLVTVDGGMARSIL